MLLVLRLLILLPQPDYYYFYYYYYYHYSNATAITTTTTTNTNPSTALVLLLLYCCYFLGFRFQVGPMSDVESTRALLMAALRRDVRNLDCSDALGSDCSEGEI